jgi:hypothetical protein
MCCMMALPPSLLADIYSLPRGSCFGLRLRTQANDIDMHDAIFITVIAHDVPYSSLTPVSHSCSSDMWWRMQSVVERRLQSS